MSLGKASWERGWVWELVTRAHFALFTLHQFMPCSHYCSVDLYLYFCKRCNLYFCCRAHIFVGDWTFFWYTILTLAKAVIESKTAITWLHLCCIRLKYELRQGWGRKGWWFLPKEMWWHCAWSQFVLGDDDKRCEKWVRSNPLYIWKHTVDKRIHTIF